MRVLVAVALLACGKSEPVTAVAGSGSASLADALQPDAFVVDAEVVPVDAPLSSEAAARIEYAKALSELMVAKKMPGIEARGEDATDAHILMTCSKAFLEEDAKMNGAAWKRRGFKRVTCDGGLARDL